MVGPDTQPVMVLVQRGYTELTEYMLGGTILDTSSVALGVAIRYQYPSHLMLVLFCRDWPHD